MVQIVKSQCPMNREFPEFFKTHPTFICSSIFKASRSLQTRLTKFDMLSCSSCMSSVLACLFKWQYFLERVWGVSSTQKNYLTGYYTRIWYKENTQKSGRQYFSETFYSVSVLNIFFKIYEILSKMNIKNFLQSLL